MQIILNNATITTSGSAVYDGLNSSEIVLLINILNTPTGTNPILSFSLQDVDPIDQTTIIGDQNSSSNIIGTSSTNLILTKSLSDTVKISWTLSGTNSPTFTGVNVSLLEKANSQLLCSSSSSLSNISASVSSVTLLAANQNRLLATIQNDSINTLYVKLGTTASTSSYTVKMIGGSYYEFPLRYTGRIDGIWDIATGTARITEFT